MALTPYYFDYEGEDYEPVRLNKFTLPDGRVFWSETYENAIANAREQDATESWNIFIGDMWGTDEFATMKDGYWFYLITAWMRTHEVHPAGGLFANWEQYTAIRAMTIGE
jgi:hypothetical protein